MQSLSRTSEKIQHVTSGRSSLANTKYKNRQVDKIIHMNLVKNYALNKEASAVPYLEYQPKPKN